MGILERGGNVFDAAVATAFTLQVVEPHLNGPGGDVRVIVHDTRKGKDKIEVICGQGPAPMGATIAHYKGLGLDLVPAPGRSPCRVPGTFQTWDCTGAAARLRHHAACRRAQAPRRPTTPPKASRWSSALASPSAPSRAAVP